MKRVIAHQTAIRVALFVLVIAGTAHAKKENRFIIDECTTITEPGSYVVTRNITATQDNVISGAAGATSACILIKADFVTINLDGFAITASNLGSTVASGISTDGVDHYGIYVHSGTVASFSRTGVVLVGEGHSVEHIRAVQNAGDGIYVASALGVVNGHRIVANTAISNGYQGIYVACPAVVLENVAAGNRVSDIATGLSPCNSQENSPLP